MILRSMALALAGCGAALASLHWALAEAAPVEPLRHFLEMPLAAAPVIEEGKLLGLRFVRLGVVGPKIDTVDIATIRTFLADAFHDAVLGQPSSDLRGIEPLRLKAAIPVRLERAGAPFALTDVMIVQSEYRSHDRLRELATED